MRRLPHVPAAFLAAGVLVIGVSLASVVPAAATTPGVHVAAPAPDALPAPAGVEVAAATCEVVDAVAIPSWARQAVCWLFQNRITTGVGNSNRYEPDGTVTRAQMAAFLWRMSGSRAAPASCGFDDESRIPGWARTAVCWLEANNVTNGFGDSNRYEPDAPVSRAQMAAFLWRLMKEPATTNECGFVDTAAIPGWAQGAVCWLRAANITNGAGTTGRYEPAGIVTRAQMAAFLWRLWDRPRAPEPTFPRNSVWDALAQCESGGNWSINTGNGFYGGLQFLHSTWVNMGGRRWAEFPHQATREQQIEVAARLQARWGWGQWPACSQKLGLR